MRSIIYLLTAIFVISLAFWSYQENYNTRGVFAKTQELRKEIRQTHARLRVLKAEWAYLNRPERLHDLANFDYNRLNLQNISPQQFTMIDQVAYPSKPGLITDEVLGTELVEIKNTQNNQMVQP